MPDMKKLKKAAVGLFWKQSNQSLEPLSPEPSMQPLSISIPTPLPATDNRVVDPTFYSAIESELNKAMDADFNEFYNQMSVINEKFSNLDEPTRYQLAFHAAQTALKARGANFTLPGLLKTIDRLNQVLDVEKREFKMQNDQGYQDNLTNVRKKSLDIGEGIKMRENRLQAIKQELETFLAAKNAEKKKLDEERSQLISQRVVVESEINQLEQKKGERESRFNAAQEAHLQRLAKLKQDLQTNLKIIK
jgi:hypothetical protein